jgi:hypothetical protein
MRFGTRVLTVVGLRATLGWLAATTPTTAPRPAGPDGGLTAGPGRCSADRRPGGRTDRGRALPDPDGKDER